MLVFLNAAIMTANGTYDMEDISLYGVENFVATRLVKSYIGRQSTADILTELLHFTVDVNREEYTHNEEDIIIVFKLNRRGEEGRIYTREEIEEIGYSFKRVWYISYNQE